MCACAFTLTTCHTHLHAYTHACTPLYTRTHTQTTHTYTHIKYISDVCAHTHPSIHTHSHTNPTSIHTYSHNAHITHMCICLHMCTCTSTLTTHIHMHVYTHPYTQHTCPHTQTTHTCVYMPHTHTHSHIYAHTCTLRRSHTYTQAHAGSSARAPSLGPPCPLGGHTLRPHALATGRTRVPHPTGWAVLSAQARARSADAETSRSIQGSCARHAPPHTHTSRGAQPHRFPPTCQQHTPRVALRGGPPLQKHVCTPSTIDTPFSVRPVLGPEPAQASGPLCGASTLLPAVGTPHPSSTRPPLSDQSGGGQVTVPFQVVIVALTRVPSKDTGPPPAPTVLAERPAPSAEAPENRGHGHVLGHGLAPSPPGPCVKKPWAVFRPVVRAPGGGEGDNLFLVNHHQNFSAGC